MHLLDICDTGLKQAIKLGAYEAEVYVTSSKYIEVGIEKNDIQLARSQIEDAVGIRVFKNKSLGFASIADFKDIRKACKRAVELATYSPRDEYNKLPHPNLPGVAELVGAKRKSRSIEVLRLYDPKSEEFSVKHALEYAISMLELSRNYDQRIMVDRSSFAAEIVYRAIANSNGVKIEETSSSFIYFIMGMAIDKDEVSSFEYEFDGVRFINKIDTKRCALDFAKKVIDSLGASKGESFRGQVILSPESVGDLIVYPILYSTNANNVQKGMSQWIGKLGAKVASSLLTVEDNGLLPEGLGSSFFDREGMPHTPLTVIENGILCSYMYNTYTANKENRNSTGHASGSASELPGIGPTNFIIKEGEIPKDELIKQIKRGVLVTRFSGFPNPTTGEFSGAIKGGWLVKNGELLIPLCQTLIQGNIYDLLPKIFAISKERKKVMNYLLPWVCIEDVSVTAG